MKTAIAASATVPDTWITLYEDGRVKVRTRNLDTSSMSPKVFPYRELTYRPKRKSDRLAIERLIGHINLTSCGLEGNACLP